MSRWHWQARWRHPSWSQPVAAGRAQARRRWPGRADRRRPLQGRAGPFDFLICSELLAFKFASVGAQAQLAVTETPAPRSGPTGTAEARGPGPPPPRTRTRAHTHTHTHTHTHARTHTSRRLLVGPPAHAHVHAHTNTHTRTRTRTRTHTHTHTHTHAHARTHTHTHTHPGVPETAAAAPGRPRSWQRFRRDPCSEPGYPGPGLTSSGLSGPGPARGRFGADRAWRGRKTYCGQPWDSDVVLGLVIGHAASRLGSGRKLINSKPVIGP